MPVAPALIPPLIVACAFFMESADANIIVTAIPAMARAFGSDPVALKIAITTYVVGVGVFIPVCGWVADRHGARTVFKAAICIFIAGSLACAASPSIHVFTLARFLQGIGGAMMVPVGRIIVVRAVPRSEFLRAMNWLGLPSMFAPVLAPLLGGFITTYLHWRLMFLINVPVGVLGIYLTNRHIANTHEPHPGPLDWTGFILTALGASLTLLGLSLIGSDMVSNRSAWEMSLVGALLLTVYVLYAQRARHPVLDLRFLQVPSFRASVLGGSMFRIGYGAVPFLLPLALQEGLGMTAFESGLITCASAFGSMFMRLLTSLTLRRFGFRAVLMHNAVFSGIAMAAYGTFSPGTARSTIWLVVLCSGFFTALQFTSLNSLMYADIDSRDVGRATSLGSIIQQMSLGIGVVVGGLVVQVARALHGHAHIMWSDFWPAFLIVGLFSLGSIPATRRLSPDAGDDMVRSSGS
ncbi:MFS transporter [Burkholderia cepacia]|uniref:MFS transporter n=1 Tax=Burkholderia cepacia TaxID=292 RepID=UPI002AB78686|nr:MFS transporter [Burkholderia cepacia]